MSKFWVDNINNHLDLLTQCCSNLPAGEKLEAEDLNEIISRFDNARNIFLFMCELHGFKTISLE